MSSEISIEFDTVSKKYSKNTQKYGTLRDDIMSVLSNSRRTDSLKKNEFWALDLISFKVLKGEAVGLYGPNGSGKSTILKLIAKVISPTKGTIIRHGRIAPLIELGAGFHPDLNGIENIYMNGAILGMTIGEIKSNLDQIVQYCELEEFISLPVKKYSSGMKLRLGFSVAIHSKADIYLFDEILAVGDESFKRKSLDSIKELSRMGKTLIIVSHDLEMLKENTDRIILIERGIVKT